MGRQSARPETVGGEVHGCFATTHWSLVLSAGQANAPQADAALEELCRTYWPPLYAYLRRRGYSSEDAQDLTQEFFRRLLEKHYLRLADQERGRFRTFLLTSLQHFLVNEWKRGQAKKRGGAGATIPWQASGAEAAYRCESLSQFSPEVVFDKAWAVTLLESALAEMRLEYSNAGKGDLFEALKGFVWGEGVAVPYREAADQLGVTEGALKVAVHRLRFRFREKLRARVADTVTNPGEIDAELRHLVTVLSA
jgi:RNA polymerase sigma-70 factor (ECF subfamily)